MKFSICRLGTDDELIDDYGIDCKLFFRLVLKRMGGWR